MSLSPTRAGWGALVLSTAISTVAVVAVPRRGNREAPETGATEARAEPRPVETPPADEAGTPQPDESPEPVPTPQAEASVPTRKAPALVTTAADPAAALVGAFAAAEGTIEPIALADRMVAIGPGAALSILQGLCGELDLEALDASGAGAPADVRERALRDAWSRYSPAVRLKAIEELASSVDTDGLRVLIALAGETGDASAVPLVLQLAGRLDPIQLARPYVVEPLEGALARCLPAGLESNAIANQLGALRGPLCPSVARAAILSGSAVAQELAFGYLGRSTETDLALLATLATPGLDTRRTLRGFQLEALRELTRARSADVRRAACIALGHARDGGAAEELVTCLDDVDPLVASAARTALRAATGKDRGATTEEWRLWLEERKRWLEEEAPQLVETVRGEDLDEIVAGIDRLFVRADARQEWTELCTELLDSDSPRGVRRATEALLQIGTADALLAIEQARTRLAGPRLRMLEAALGAAR